MLWPNGTSEQALCLPAAPVVFQHNRVCPWQPIHVSAQPKVNEETVFGPLSQVTLVMMAWLVHLYHVTGSSKRVGAGYKSETASADYFLV